MPSRVEPFKLMESRECLPVGVTRDTKGEGHVQSLLESKHEFRLANADVRVAVVVGCR